MQVLSVVGARPQFVKLAPITKALSGRADHVVVHTGQHYDPEMSDAFFRDLGIPEPDLNLAIGSGTHGVQTGAMLAAIEAEIDRRRPDWVLVYGDTNSTIAAALAAVKLHVPVAHLEAGLRSRNRRMPEEHNRVLTDHASDLLLAPTEVAMRNLAAEGLADRSIHVGDVMTDVLYATRDEVAAAPPELGFSEPERGFYLATIHRPGNTDDPRRLRLILAALGSLDHPVVLAAHPRLVAIAERAGIRLDHGAIRVVPPLSYPALVRAVSLSAGVVTDSGGLQKEAFLLRVPCTTVRGETEWVETIELGWNILVEDPEAIVDAVGRPLPEPTDAAPYGDGHAAVRVADALVSNRR